MNNWKATLRSNLRKISPEKAREIYTAHCARGPGIGDPAYRELTGGYSSQAIDFHVTRSLAVRAGIIRG